MFKYSSNLLPPGGDTPQSYTNLGSSISTHSEFIKSFWSVSIVQRFFFVPLLLVHSPHLSFSFCYDWTQMESTSSELHNHNHILYLFLQIMRGATWVDLSWFCEIPVSWLQLTAGADLNTETGSTKFIVTSVTSVSSVSSVNKMLLRHRIALLLLTLALCHHQDQVGLREDDYPKYF